MTMKCVHPQQFQGSDGNRISCYLCNAVLTKKEANSAPAVCPGTSGICGIMTCSENQNGNCLKKYVGPVEEETEGNGSGADGDGVTADGDTPPEVSGEGEGEGTEPEPLKCGNIGCEFYTEQSPFHCNDPDAPPESTVDKCCDYQPVAVDASASIPAEPLTYTAGDEQLSDVFMHPLPVFLTDVELGKYSQEQARLYQELVGVKELKKAETARYNKRIKALEEQLEKISGVVEDGTEERPVESRWVYNYSAGEKRLVRLDDGKEVERQNLTAEEIQKARQPALFDQATSIENVERCFGAGAASVPASDLAEEFTGRHCGNDECEHFSTDRPWNCGAPSEGDAPAIESCENYRGGHSGEEAEEAEGIPASGENKNYSAEANDSPGSDDFSEAEQGRVCPEEEKPVTGEIS